MAGGINPPYVLSAVCPYELQVMLCEACRPKITRGLTLEWMSVTGGFGQRAGDLPVPPSVIHALGLSGDV